MVDKRRRDVQHTVKVTIRLSPDDHALLERVADDERVPVAVLVRQILMADLKKRPPPDHAADTPRTKGANERTP